MRFFLLFFSKNLPASKSLVLNDKNEIKKSYSSYMQFYTHAKTPQIKKRHSIKPVAVTNISIRVN